MKLRTIVPAAALLLAGCAPGFKSEEIRLIRTGGDGIMRVLTIGVPTDSVVLRGKSEPVTLHLLRSEDFGVLRRRMLATVQDPQNTGVGIAAPQVGILRQLIAVQRFDKPGEPFEFYLNPEITARSAETAAGPEGCLSIPERYDTVIRSQRITLRYRDERFVERTETVEGFTAVVFQHETDHLNGVLYIDRLK